MQLIQSSSSDAEVRDLWAVLSDALVPDAGPAETTQGQLLRAQGNLASEYFRNGMMNYYAACREPRRDSYVEQLDFLIDVLLPMDRDYLGNVRTSIREERGNLPEIHALQEKEEESGLSEAESARLAALCIFDAWEELFDRTERLVLNYCILHPLPSFAALLQRDEDGPPNAPAPAPKDAPGWLGLQVTWSSAGLLVDDVHPASPATGKLQAGDVIDWIDGERTATFDGAAWAMKLLGGPQGSMVFLRVGPRLVKIVRAARPD